MGLANGTSPAMRILLLILISLVLSGCIFRLFLIYKSAKGRVHVVVVPDEEAASRVYIVAFHKAGSSMVSQTVHDLLKTDITQPAQCLSIESSSFGQKSADTAKCRTLVYFTREGNGIDSSSPINFSNSSIQEELRAAKSCSVILRIRHPFDSVVSGFQSFTTPNHYIKFKKGSPEYIEVLKERAILHMKGVDRYALDMMPGMDRNIRAHFQNLVQAERQGCRVWISRFEDMISFPRTFFTQLSEELNVERSEAWKKKVHQLVQQQEELLPNENTHTAFIFPGQYRKALRNETIFQLTQTMSNFTLERSGYF
jgi:hypothetical protein